MALGFKRMSNQMRYLLLFGTVAIRSVELAHGQIATQAYKYNGGTFTVKTVFNFYTSVETDSLDGTSHLQAILKITNTSTGRSFTTSFISENDFIKTVEGNVLVGNELVHGQLNPRTNTGIVTINGSSLGPGPLVFSAAGVSELTGRAPAPIRNVFGGPFYVWTIRPQSITPSLSPWKPPAGRPVAVPPVGPIGPVVTNIHAVIISGRSDPAKVVSASSNVTLTGGIVALGKNPGSSGAPSNWAPGLRIVPDDALLTGKKIPPVTPNIIDVRIVKHEVVGDLASPDSSPAP
jgi:hypothetical protein